MWLGDDRIEILDKRDRKPAICDVNKDFEDRQLLWRRLC